MALRARFRLSSVAFATALLLSRVAWACPACLGSGRNIQLLKLGGFFMLLPLAVVLIVLYVLRGAPEARDASAPAEPKRLGR
jgi:predicted cobalt transporter CbtA